MFDARVVGPKSGERVLLLHGFPQTSFEWRSQLTALAGAGYRAVAPDQRGYSPGARPPDVASYGIDAIAGDALGMADALGYERFHVVGHDWGAVVAWVLATVAPERVQTLTALSWPHPGAFAEALADTQSCQYRASSYFDVYTKENVTLAELLQASSGTSAGPPDGALEYFTKVAGNPQALDAALDWYRANVAGRRVAETIPLGTVRVPTLFVWGSADGAFCRDVAEGSAAYVSAPYRFVALEGAGHWLPEANALQVNEELLRHVSR